jgi:hypothetical protein
VGSWREVKPIARPGSARYPLSHVGYRTATFQLAYGIFKLTSLLDVALPLSCALESSGLRVVHSIANTGVIEICYNLTRSLRRVSFES